MCIIAAKPANVNMPSRDTIETMWKNNDDGAGFMWVEKGKVYIEKGFMKYKDFIRALEELESRVDMFKTPIVMHFRITTHGGTNPENCHPFPITDSVGVIKKLRMVTDIGMAHNGILTIKPRDGISDTMEYILSQVSVMKKMNRKFLLDKRMITLIENATRGSRLCFLDSTGKITTTGNFIEEDGVLYSNSNYKPYYGSWYRWGLSGCENKMLCDVRAAGMFVEDDSGVYDDEWKDYYIDRDYNVYSYNMHRDIFIPEKSLRTGSFSFGSGFDYEKSFEASVADENDNSWGDYLCKIDGCIVSSDGETYDTSLLTDDFWMNEYNEVFMISDDGKFALLMEEWEPFDRDMKIPVFHIEDAVYKRCMYEYDYYEYFEDDKPF